MDNPVSSSAQSSLKYAAMVWYMLFIRMSGSKLIVWDSEVFVLCFRFANLKID